MTSAKKLAKQRRKRLVDVAVWAAGEHAKQELGLPSEWKQTVWIGREGCGTACCIAGKVALDAGARPAVCAGGEYVRDPERAATLWLSDDWEGGDTHRVFVPGETEPVSVAGYAAELLGLTDGQKTRLFDAATDLYGVLDVIGEALDQLDAEYPPAVARTV